MMVRRRSNHLQSDLLVIQAEYLLFDAVMRLAPQQIQLVALNVLILGLPAPKSEQSEEPGMRHDH
jgi:hypothetical protein